MKLQPSTAFSNILCFTFSLCLFALTAHAQNPIATYYGSQDYPAWTDQIQWENQIDMSTYTEGANDFEKFEHARDALFSQGGGVLYYPGGDYDFSDAPLDQIDGRGLMLKTGVVILGETPSTDADAIDGSLNLPTRFVFPMTDKGEGVVPKPWNIIGITPGAGEALKDVSKVGVAWVEVDGAAVYFGADMSWGSTYATAGAWYSSYASHGVWANRQPDGTHPIDPFAGIGSDRELLGSGSERFVFGCKLVNSTIINDGQIDYPRDGSFGYYMYKFGARISIYGSNVFVGNNLLPASTENFFYTQNTGITQQDQCGQFFGTHESILLFDYGKTLGIDVNKNLLNLCNNKLEGYLLPNAIIRDNYIYNHGHKGLDVSGSWVVIRNNHNERDYLSEGDNVYGFGADWELTLDGFFESVPGGNGCLSDNLSRAYDLAGSNIWVTSNTWNNLGSNPGNDGESILSQRHGGTEIISWAVTHNAHLPSYSYANTGYLCGYDVHNLGMLVAWNETKGTVGNLKAGQLKDAAFIASGEEETININYIVPGGGDYITDCPEGAVLPPSDVQVERIEEGNFIQISWTDQTDEEIGYRIEKRLEGAEEGEVVAYRPRQSEGVPENEPVWRDYCAPLEGALEYRVVAVNCDNTANGASPWVSLNAPSDTEGFTALQPAMTVFPNPAKDAVWAICTEAGGQLYIFAPDGTQLRNQAANGLRSEVNLTGLPAGIYLMKWVKADKQVVQRFYKH